MGSISALIVASVGKKSHNVYNIQVENVYAMHGIMCFILSILMEEHCNIGKF